MRFLPFINGKLFLVIYGVYAVALIILLSKKLKGNDEYYVATGLDEVQYYVLDNKYSLENMFYYITYRLYAKGILLKNEEEKTFYVNKSVSTYLSSIEKKVYRLYLEKFAPKDFKSSMLNENQFKGYYYSIYNELITKGLIKDSDMIKKNKSTLKMGILIIFIPGVWRLIGGIASNMPVTALVMEIIITFIIIRVVLSSRVNDNLTNKGYASKRAFEKQYNSIINDSDSSSNTNGGYANTMQEFLIGAAWMNFLGVNNIYKNSGSDTSTFFNNDSSFDSSDSGDSSDSSDSGSSCSACSSCGGCGSGGD
ncbi:hypothetical protein HBE96_17715 [Clostridium sp. P21]|uniref:TIGR04222 domain-containing membrane protein n=1 Tax=Clostridium muellerianum TaxID=2716538 RepID=A0A7Y0HQ76_9CLOT|nr:hypothetical protein [Clostridium muellerianum]NMM64457.1 hypothetical protein [Clostridium muellerianum]